MFSMQTAFPRYNLASLDLVDMRSQSWVVVHTLGRRCHHRVVACVPLASPRSQNRCCTSSLDVRKKKRHMKKGTQLLGY